MPADPAAARAVFLEAAVLDDPAARAALVASRCGGDPQLLARVNALLAANDRALADEGTVSFADASATRDPAGTVDRPGRAEEAEGAVVAGRYKLRQPIGEGGMGTVWMADQTEPVKRKVAVKLIRVERGQSKTILARFEAERQAIALMDHPHIAKLLDAGTTDAGAPFFVMELVKGVPLSDYCDQHRLTVAERLTLFTQVCGAVQHAHQKGVIHRDLKPGNILVESHDGRAVPKVIDFGLAKATTGLQLTDQSLFTAFGSVMGTPLYMAPEQATFNAVDVDTRADVYALGVILYELLTGTTPLTRESLKKAALDEVLRLVREQEAPTPSSRLSSADSTPSVAANRQIEPQKLGRFVKGELDWIVMKALAKERDRRYETANGFARDIERFLNHEPVQAGPPSRAYRLKKFVRRNRGQVIAAGLVLLALVAGVVGTTLGLLRAEEKRGEAEQARGAEAERAEGEKWAKEEAQRAFAAETSARRAEEQERQYAQAVAAFVKDDFLALTSVEGQTNTGEEGLDRHATLRTLLERAATKLKGRKDLAPRIEAELCWIVGINYRGVGEAMKGVPFLERAVQLRTEHLGRGHADTITALNSLGVNSTEAGYPEKALPLFREALALSTKWLGPDHEVRLVVMENLADCQRQLGASGESVQLYQEVFERCQAKLGPVHRATLRSMNGLAIAYQAAGKRKEAMALKRTTLDLRKKHLGPDHPETLTSMGNLAIILGEDGRLDECLALCEQAAKLSAAKYGPDHPTALHCLADKATALIAAGRFKEALELQEQVYRARKEKLGADHPSTLSSLNNLAGAVAKMGQYPRALALVEEALALANVKFGPTHPTTLQDMRHLGEIYLGLNQLDKAIPHLEETLKLCRAHLGNDHRFAISAMISLGKAISRSSKPAPAKALLEEAVERARANLGPEHPETLVAMNSLAVHYSENRDLDRAVSLFEETLKVRRGLLGDDHPKTLESMLNMAATYGEVGKHDRAVSLAEEAYKHALATLGADHPFLSETQAAMAARYRAAKRFAKAVPHFEELVKRLSEKLGPDHPDTINAVDGAWACHFALNNLEPAMPLLERSLAHRLRTPGSKQEEISALYSYLIDGYMHLGRPASAVPHIERSIPLLKARHGAESREVLARMVELADALMGSRDPQKAAPALEEVLRMSRAIHGPEHGLTVQTMAELGKVYCQSKQGEKAAAVAKEFVAALRKVQKDPPRFAGALAAISLDLLGCGEWQAAEGFLRECLTVREAKEPDAWTTFNTQALLGGALLGQKKYADAEPLLVKGYEGMKAREDKISKVPQAATRIPESLDRLIELYTATNKPDEVKKYQELRAKYPGKLDPPKEP